MKSTDVKGDSAVITLTDLKKEGNRTKHLMDILFEKKYYSHIHPLCMYVCVISKQVRKRWNTYRPHSCQKHVHLGTLKISTTSNYSSCPLQKNAKSICNNSFAKIIVTLTCYNMYVCCMSFYSLGQFVSN